MSNDTDPGATAVLSYESEAEAKEHQKLWPDSEYFLSVYGLWFLRVRKGGQLMSTEHEATAKRLIPCDVFCTAKRHDKRCKHGLRSAVAAALAAAEARGAEGDLDLCQKCERRVPRQYVAVETEDGAYVGMWCVVCHDQKVLAHLRSENERLKAEVERLEAHLCTAKDALEWCVNEGGWRLFYYADETPNFIDVKTDLINPRLKEIPACSHKAERDAAEVKVKELSNAMNWRDHREFFHQTYNGGHHDKIPREAFHHGMDTVFNALDKWADAIQAEINAKAQKKES